MDCKFASAELNRVLNSVGDLLEDSRLSQSLTEEERRYFQEALIHAEAFAESVARYLALREQNAEVFGQVIPFPKRINIEGDHGE